MAKERQKNKRRTILFDFVLNWGVEKAEKGGKADSIITINLLVLKTVPYQWRCPESWVCLEGQLGVTIWLPKRINF